MRVGRFSSPGARLSSAVRNASACVGASIVPTQSHAFWSLKYNWYVRTPDLLPFWWFPSMSHSPPRARPCARHPAGPNGRLDRPIACHEAAAHILYGSIPRR